MSSLVCINGSPRRVSRTAVLVDAMAAEIAARVSVDRRSIHMAVHGRDLLSGLTRETLSPDGEALCRLVEGADVLVVASPVYRASYTGLLKHLFDLVDRDTMRGRKAVLLASGGTPCHGLVLEHQFRPLMGFFGIHTVPTAIYALEDDIVRDQIVEPGVRARVAHAADEIAGLLSLQPASRLAARAA